MQADPRSASEAYVGQAKKAIGEVLDKFEGKKFTCEYKYDGERAQVSGICVVNFGKGC